MSSESFLSACKRLLKLATRPGRREIWHSIRICLLGVGLIGVIGFIIRFISAMLQGFVPTT